MKLGQAFKTFVEDSKNTDTYWVEKAKLDFSIALEKQRESAKMTYAAIAKKLGTSAAYITKVFRGDSNMTIETMVKLARATGGQVDIQIVDTIPKASAWDTRSLKLGAKSTHTTLASAIFIELPCAANHSTFESSSLAAAA